MISYEYIKYNADLVVYLNYVIPCMFTCSSKPSFIVIKSSFILKNPLFILKITSFNQKNLSFKHQ